MLTAPSRHEQKLTERGYKIKEVPLGWVVTGRQDLIVCGAMPTFKKAVRRARSIVARADMTGMHPQWYFGPVF